MKVIKLNELSKKDYQRIVKRSAGTNPEIMPKVKKTMEDVTQEIRRVFIQSYQGN